MVNQVCVKGGHLMSNVSCSRCNSPRHYREGIAFAIKCLSGMTLADADVEDVSAYIQDGDTDVEVA